MADTRDGEPLWYQRRIQNVGDYFASPVYGDGKGARAWESYDDTGGPSRFFYCAKASREEREAGCDLEPQRRTDGRSSERHVPNLRTNWRRNDHPTVKPTELMRWLVRMVKMPADTTILDPFMGSGSTGVACAAEGVDFIGIEREAEYLEIARRRIDA